MYIGRDWDPLDVGEDDVFTLDFVKDLTAGETITPGSATVTVVALRGLDPAPSANLIGAASLSGTKVSQEFKGGIAGEKYRLIGTVTTNLPRPAIKLWSHFECRDPTLPS